MMIHMIHSCDDGRGNADQRCVVTVDVFRDGTGVIAVFVSCHGGLKITAIDCTWFDDD